MNAAASLISIQRKRCEVFGDPTAIPDFRTLLIKKTTPSILLVGLHLNFGGVSRS